LYFAGDFNPLLASNVNLAALEALVPVDRGSRIVHPLGGAFDNRLPVMLSNGTIRLTSIADMVNWNARAFILGPNSWNVDASVVKTFNIKETLKLRALGVVNAVPVKSAQRSVNSRVGKFIRVLR
jgi:hypothetical protein